MASFLRFVGKDSSRREVGKVKKEEVGRFRRKVGKDRRKDVGWARHRLYTILVILYSIILLLVKGLERMPSSKNYKRDYKQERRTAKKRGETGVGSKSGDATRHRARRAYEKKNGKLKPGEQLDHKKPLKSGGSNSPSNVRKRSASANMSHGGKIGNRKGKAAGGRKGKK